MVILNLIYFCIITLLAVNFLLSGGKELKNPFNKDQVMSLTGPEMFWILTFSTGLLAFSGDIGFDLMAIRLAVLEILCIIGLSISKNKVQLSLPLYIYIIYLVWLFVGLFYGHSASYGWRTILKYSYPFLLCLFASSAVRDIEVWMKSGLWARIVALVGLIFGVVPLIGTLVPGVFWYGTARAINFISIIVFSLGLAYFTDEKKKNLIFAILFIIPCFLWVYRTSIMGSLIAVMAFAFIKLRLKSLPLIVGTLILGVLAVFFIPSLNQKMFKKDSDVSLEQFQQGQVTMDNVETNAREAMWEHLENKFYKGHEIIGSGTGAVQHYMYNNFIFGGLKVPHSDFVQQRCDNGLIALVLYCLISLGIFIHCFKAYWSTENVAIKLAAIVAGASLAGVFVTHYSDNTLNYSMATLSMPYGFYGMLLGLLAKEKE